MTRRSLARWLALAALVLFATGRGVALGQAPAASAPSASPPADDAQALAGPKVGTPAPSPVEIAASRTLVRREFDGRLIRLDVRPEQAALDLLDLTPAQREATGKILAERFAACTRMATDNYELFLALQAARQGGAGGPPGPSQAGATGAGQSGERAQLMSLVRRFREAGQHLLTPSLADTLSAALDAERARGLHQLCDEYIRALADEDTATRSPDAQGAPGGQPRQGPLAARVRVETNLLIREVARSFGSLVASRRDRTEELLKAIEPESPEQEAKIRATIRTMGEKGGLTPTNEQRGELIRAVMAELSPEQRRRLLAHLRG